MDTLCDGEEHTLTSPLVKYVRFRSDAVERITKELPQDWPFWCKPDYSEVEKEIKADPIWDEWYKKTQE